MIDVDVFVKTFFLVFLVEVGSASQFTIAAISSQTEKYWVVWLAGVLALAVTSWIGAYVGTWLHKIPISPELISGIILLALGAFFLWKS